MTAGFDRLVSNQARPRPVELLDRASFHEVLGDQLHEHRTHR
jgi:hypothetical protein